MTARELALLVRQCREAQRRYFRERGQDTLEESKKLERAVDEAVSLVLEPSLFNREETGG